DRPLNALVLEFHMGGSSMKIKNADILRLVDGGRAGGGARVHQVLRHLGLAVDDDVAPGEPLEVDAKAPPGEGKLEAPVDEALGAQALADAGLVEQIRAALLEQSGAD